MTKNYLVWIILLLPVLGAGAGYMSGPFVARMDDTVSLANRIWLEESRGLQARTFESRVYRETGRSISDLYDEARRIIERISLATAVLGAWSGLVVSFQIGRLLRTENRDIYDIELGQCVVCARCFHTCPREKKRRQEREKWRPKTERSSMRRLMDWLETAW